MTLERHFIGPPFSAPRYYKLPAIDFQVHSRTSDTTSPKLSLSIFFGATLPKQPAAFSNLPHVAPSRVWPFQSHQAVFRHGIADSDGGGNQRKGTEYYSNPHESGRAGASSDRRLTCNPPRSPPPFSPPRSKSTTTLTSIGTISQCRGARQPRHISDSSSHPMPSSPRCSRRGTASYTPC